MIEISTIDIYIIYVPKPEELFFHPTPLWRPQSWQKDAYFDSLHRDHFCVGDYRTNLSDFAFKLIKWNKNLHWNDQAASTNELLTYFKIQGTYKFSPPPPAPVLLPKWTHFESVCASRYLYHVMTYMYIRAPWDHLHTLIDWSTPVDLI